MTHKLKVWPIFYRDLVSGKKPFEVRKMDRPFKVGDKLLLQEWRPGLTEYTGREILLPVIYLLRGGKFGIKKGYCVMGLREIKP